MFPSVETRFDLVLVDATGKCLRAQVKYAAKEPSTSVGSVCLDLRKETRNNGKKRLYSKQDTDIILAYIPQVQKIVCIESNIFENVKTLNFRFETPKNGQIKGIRMVNDFVW